jgi:hypothetical protein
VFSLFSGLLHIPSARNAFCFLLSMVSQVSALEAIAARPTQFEGPFSVRPPSQPGSQRTAWALRSPRAEPARPWLLCHLNLSLARCFARRGAQGLLVTDSEDKPGR